MPAPRSHVLARLGAALVRARWPLCLFVAALIVRLHWNLHVHPPGDYVYSDMRGYLSMARRAAEDPWSPHEYAAFYPWGTHVLFAASYRLFPADPLRAVAVTLALLGALVPPAAHALARRASRWPAVVAPLLGLVLVFDYPLLALGGYALSEVPFALTVVASSWLALRLADTGRRRDAWALGAVLAAGAALRPQILLAVALWGLLWLARRRSFPRLRPALLAHAAVPLVLVLAGSALRLHHHTGRWGLISENGSFNRVFGRCHVTSIRADPDRLGRVRTGFSPPAFLQLRHRAKLPGRPWPQLDPVGARKIVYRGYIGDARIHQGFIDDCLARSSLGQQLSFAATHVALLWDHNVMWPDSGRVFWQRPARWWGDLHRRYVGLPAAWALLVPLLGRRFARLAVPAMQLWGLLLVAGLYMGSMRMRVPYDPLWLLFALEAYVGLLVLAGRAVRAAVAHACGRNPRGGSPVQGVSSPAGAPRP